MKKIFITPILAFLMTGVCIAQVRTYYADPDLVPREHPVDFTHLKLEVSFDTTKGEVKGSVSQYFTVLQQSVDSILLDGPGIEIASAKLDKKNVKYKTNKDGVILYFTPALKWDEQHQIDIDYVAHPSKGIYFVGWNDPAGKSRKQIWTQGQGIDNRHWIPMYDTPNDKMTTEMIVQFDSRYKVLSNGRKMSEKQNKDGTTTWHYLLKKPHPTYLIMLGIGDYRIREVKSKSGVPIYLWYYPDWENRVDATYRYTAEIMDFLEEETGTPYPWDSYSQIPVQDFLYGAMENTTATIFGDFYCTDERGFWDRNYVRVNAHEMAHQWFGNMVSARTSSHQWLQESFATHYDLTWQGHAFGEDHFNWQRREAQEEAINASKADYKPIAHGSAGTTRHYPKGSHVLQMLKYVVGEEEFNRTIKYYLQKHAYGNVDSEDLLIAFHEKLGLSLDWFWEEWVYKGGEPAYKVTFREMEMEGKKYGVFEVEQVHERNEFVGLFDMPIVFEVYYKDGTKDEIRSRIHEEHHEVLVPLDKTKKIAFALFDPNSEIMKKFYFDKPLEMLKEQALHAKHMIDRYDAVAAMSSYPADQKRAVLHAVFAKEKFHEIKAAVIEQLLYDVESQELISTALNDKDPLVRKAVVSRAGYVPTALLPEYEKLLKDSSYEVIEITLGKLSFLYPDNREKYLEITKDETGIFGKNIRVKWLEIAYEMRKDEKYVKELVSYTSPSNEFRTRINAAEALNRLNYFDETLMTNLIDGLFSFNSRLRGPMSNALDHYYDQTAFRKIIFDHINYPGRYSADQRNRLRKFLRF